MTETAFIPFSATASTGNQPTRVSLSPGGSWASYEQFRLSGSSGLVAGVAESQVGFLNVKGVEFAILRRRDFERLFALATDALRLMRGVPLFRSAVELILSNQEPTGRKIAIRHLEELTLTFPELVTASGSPFAPIELPATPGGDDQLDPVTFEPPRANTLAVAD